MVGVRVGSCMCPDGKMYEVGDANKGKGDCAPACYGGISKKDQCKASNDGASSHNQVKCSEKHGELAEDALDDHEKYEEALKQAKAMLTEKKSDGTLKYPKGKEDENYKEKVQEAMKWLAAAKAKFRKLRGSEPTQTFPKTSWKINSFEPPYTFFSEFGTHWQEYAQMGARYGLKTVIKNTKLEKLETSGFSIAASASFAYKKMAERCPGDPCKAKEMKNKLGDALRKQVKDKKAKAYDPKDYSLNEGQSVMIERNGLEREQELEFTVETRPKVRTVHRSGGGGRQRKYMSELVGWEEVVVPVGASTEEALGFERIIGSASGSASGSHDTSDSMQNSFEQSSESTNIISLGAPPAGDVLEWAENAHHENMPILYDLSSICHLVKLALERDFPGQFDRGDHKAPASSPDFMNIKVTDQLKQEVVNACNWAQYDDHYCMYLKSEGAFMTMTCDTPPGGVERIPKKPECLSNMQCEGKRSPMHNKCVQGKCVMQYRRLVDVGVMTTQDVNSNQCSNMKGKGWTDVKIEPTNDLGNNIKGGTSDSKIRLCAKYSDEPVVAKDGSTHGVCKMMLSAYDACFPADGYNYVTPQLGGQSDGDMNQWEHDPPLWLCVSKDGCEGRGNDDISKPVPALSNIGLARTKDGKCPSYLREGVRIATRGSANGDLNQGMNSGGDVIMCEQHAKAML